MGFRRFAAARGKQDANASGIIKALKRCGATVIDMHALGGGVPDLVCGYQGRNILMEIKARPKATNAGVHERQETFAREWRGDHVIVVRSEAEALTALGIRLDT